MFEIQNFPQIFDILIDGKEHSLSPTDKNIQTIESCLGIKLPLSFVHFCQRSKYYSQWFCCLGSKYSSYRSLLKANKYFKRQKRRYSVKSIYKNVRESSGKHWVNIKPDNFVIIRWGHDDHCLVFDVSKTGSNGEYGLIYWDPGYDIEFRDSYSDFNTYMQSFLQYLYEEADSETKEQCKKYITS